VLDQGYIPIIGQGKARWNNVHVEDLSDVYQLLVAKAVANDRSEEIWGGNGYILTENGEHVWTDLARSIATQAAQLGYISRDPKEGSLGKAEAIKQAGFEAVSWGLNSRGKAERARKYLGWQPVKPSIEDEVLNIIKQERESMAKF
jgi:nucleoside-diphosphate-sugar epimerase